MAKKVDEVHEFLASYPTAVADIALALRSLITSAIPDAKEDLDRPARIVEYSLGAGYSGLVCTIIPGKTGVKLGVVGGADLADPHKLMEGRGKRHRYVQFKSISDLKRAGVASVLVSAKTAAASRGHRATS